MRLNKFTRKSLNTEFPFLPAFWGGQAGVTRRTCGNCGQTFGSIQKPEHNNFGHPQCPKCDSYGSHNEVIAAWMPPHPRIEEVLVRKVDEGFLRSVPQSYSWTGSAVDIDRGSEIRFVLRDDQAGFKVTAPVECQSESGSNYAHSDTTYSDGESVAHAIERMGLEPAVIVAIVEWQYGIRTVDHSSEGQRLVIWKAGKVDGLISTVISRLYAEAADQVKAECDL